MIAVLRRLVGGSRTYAECRHCGTAVGPEIERCPACAHDGIAAYEIE